MASSTKATTSATDDSTVGSLIWDKPENTTADDATYATASLFGPKTSDSHYLHANTFSFAIPDNAIINGILVGIHEKASAASASNFCVDSAVKIVKADGSIGSTNKASASNWPTSETDITYGGVSDLWGETWTPADINDADFGVVLSVSLTAATGTLFTTSVDYIYITVTYTERIPRNSGSVFQNPCIL
jgi:hypothetical protein